MQALNFLEVTCIHRQQQQQQKDKNCLNSAGFTGCRIFEIKAPAGAHMPAGSTQPPRSDLNAEREDHKQCQLQKCQRCWAGFGKGVQHLVKPQL